MRAPFSGSNSPPDPVLEMLARLWQVKSRSIALLEDWLKRPGDFEIKAGLTGHLAEERRHLRILGDEIKRSGGRQAPSMLDQALARPFVLVAALQDEAARLRVFHHGIKASTTLQYSRLTPLVDARLGRVLEEINRDEERHIRWATLRLSRTPGSAGREMDAMTARVEEAMAGIWVRLWRQISQQGQRARAG